jgi:acyl-coenzyme A synthetase/AMP-(fatty) acid ligase
LIVDKDLESYAKSLELTVPTVGFEDVTQFTDEDGTFEFETLTDEEREHERELPAFYLHTSGSTGHPKIIAQVCDMKQPLLTFKLLISPISDT